MRTFGSLVVLLLSLSFVIGCGSGENQVITPTEDYQPTEQEQANTQQAAESRQEQGFSGN